MDIDNSMYTNINKYVALQRRSCAKLPEELSNSMNTKINIHNKNYKCFWCCHV